MVLRTDLTGTTSESGVHADQHNQVNQAVLNLQAVQVTLDSTTADIKAVGSAAAGALAVGARADHVHPVGNLAYVIVYNTNTSSWPARPATTVVAAGQVVYTSPTSAAALPVDAQPGDLVVIPQGAAPVFTASAPPDGFTSSAYSYQFAASNTPTSWAVASGTLPAGLSLNSSTGLLSGTPTTNIQYTFTVSASNAGGVSTSSSITMTISTVFNITNSSTWSPGSNVGSNPTVDAVNTHNSASSLKWTVGAVAQVWSNVSTVVTGIVPNTYYSMPQVWMESVANTPGRKGYVQVTFQTSGGATTLTPEYDSPTYLDPINNTWQQPGRVLKALAPATAAQVQVLVTYQSNPASGGVNLTSGEVVSFTLT